MAVAKLTPAIGAVPTVTPSTLNSAQHKLAVGYCYGGTPRYVSQGQGDYIAGPSGVVMTRREALAYDTH